MKTKRKQGPNAPASLGLTPEPAQSQPNDASHFIEKSKPWSADGAGSQAVAGTFVEATAEKRSPSFLSVSPKDVAAVRASGDASKQAQLLHQLATDRSNLVLPNDDARIARTEQLFENMTVAESDTVRAAYIEKYGCDPEIHINSVDLGQPLARLDRSVARKMLGALNGATFTQTASTLHTLLTKANSQTLSAGDRKTYFAMLPMLGLWNAPSRAAATDASLDAQERILLKDAWAQMGSSVPLNEAFKRIEAAMPQAPVAHEFPRDKSIAVIASSNGAQWQELMDWAQDMHQRGYHLQVFTPEGKPVGFQRDSLAVSTRTVPLGYGSPAHLNPRGEAGSIARDLLANTAPASTFDASQFGGVYLAGGLGFNEDVAVATPERLPNGKTHTKLEANKNIAALMDAAVAERLPIVSLCHGPTLFAASSMVVNGKKEPLNKGIETASLPPFEGYVGLTGRKELQFTYDVNTHAALAEAGGQTHVLKDIKDMSRVVYARKDGMDVISGPGPQAARNLAGATVEAMKRRWPSASP